MTQGLRIQNLMRAFNTKHGQTRAGDHPSHRMLEPVEMPVPVEDYSDRYEEALDRYYDAMGWDRDTTKPLPETLKKYPFPFVLRLGYKLSEEGVTVNWTVTNPADSDMFFSIGGHPAFNCNLEADKLLFLKQDKPCGSIKTNIIAGDGSGCLSNKSKEIALDDGKLSLSYELFDEDALIIQDSQADKVVLLDSSGAEIVAVSFDSPLFGIWSPAGKKAPFVCIEPWYGRCDRVNFSGDISEREYGNHLGGHESFCTSYTIQG